MCIILFYICLSETRLCMNPEHKGEKKRHGNERKGLQTLFQVGMTGEKVGSCCEPDS